jgi:glucose/arabinose dehydrogenase
MKQLFLAFSLFGFLSAQSQSTLMIGNTEVYVDTVFTGLDIPWEIQFDSEGRLWTTERKGIVSWIDPVLKTRTIVSNLASSVYQSSESGLLGMALHPDFPNTPEIFLAYTYGNFNSIKERIVKFSFDGTTLIPLDTLITEIPGYTSHIGCRLQFLPDTTLLASTGDAQDLSTPQNLNSVNGKILRMHTDGSIPADNPFPNSLVYSYGHRNVQGILSAPNGTVYLSEHGNTTDDEFQILEMGRNYGWPDVEGFCDLTAEQTFCSANNVKEPLTQWTPTIAPSDLVWYDNPDFPEWDGKILLSILKGKRIIAIELSEDGTQYISQTPYLNNTFGRLRDICIGPNREIYLATNGQTYSNSTPNTHSIIRLTPVIPINIGENRVPEIKISPNPVNDFLQIETRLQELGMAYQIKDLSGRVFLQGRLEGSKQSIATDLLPKGMYFLSIQGHENNLNTLKFVK